MARRMCVMPYRIRDKPRDIDTTAARLHPRVYPRSRGEGLWIRPMFILSWVCAVIRYFYESRTFDSVLREHVRERVFTTRVPLHLAPKNRHQLYVANIHGVRARHRDAVAVKRCLPTNAGRWRRAGA